MELGLMVGGIVVSCCGFFFILSFSCRKFELNKSQAADAGRQASFVGLQGFKGDLEAAD
jgi:hypothetical protein